MPENKKRESLSSRLGFILLSAGCAIGLGNIWRFPYVCGQGGGAFFVLLYLLFLVLLGFPCLVMELAIGRASRSTLPEGLAILSQQQKLKKTWKNMGRFFFIGNVVLLMFYVVITGWLLKYAVDYITGDIMKLQADAVAGHFGAMVTSASLQLKYTAFILLSTMLICSSGLQKGVERVTKILMVGLLFLLLICAGHAILQDNTFKGLKFFLIPNISNLTRGFGNTIYTAMNQAFFTLSIGIGSIEIFGSYSSKEKTLCNEAIIIIILDTFVAIMAGLMLFPYCYSCNIAPDAGPPLIFITLPKAFKMMVGGRLFGTFFSIFITLAALTTVIAVCENIIAFLMEEFRQSRKIASFVTCFSLYFLSIPCILGFNIWSNFQPLGEDSNVLDLEDFIISNNLLPLGALMMVFFCTRKFGWCIDNFFQEANTGLGIKLAKYTKFYLSYVLPAIIFLVWLMGIILKFKG